MGRMLGAFDEDDTLERPDLNKCPDCDCYFAEETCPLCGKVCPEEFRAGKRKAVKKKKRTRGSHRVTFIDWYHRWWFIVLMLLLFPLMGVILLITSPHKKSHKIIAIVIAVVYTVVSSIGVGNIITYVSEMLNAPVDTSLSETEYKDAREEVSAEDFYRSPEAYEDRFLKMALTVKERMIDIESYESGGKHTTYYICESRGGENFSILVRDCQVGFAQNLIEGDSILVYGEGGGSVTVYDAAYNVHEGPCLNGAYVEMQ